MKHRNTCAKFLNEINSESFQAGFSQFVPPAKPSPSTFYLSPMILWLAIFYFLHPLLFLNYRFGVFNTDRGIRFAAFINCPIQRRQSTPR